MTRGIHLKTLSATDLGYLGLPPDLAAAQSLEQGRAGASPAGLDALLDLITSDTVDEQVLAAATEVRQTLEEVLGLLDEALAPGPHQA